MLTAQFVLREVLTPFSSLANTFSTNKRLLSGSNKTIPAQIANVRLSKSQ